MAGEIQLNGTTALTESGGVVTLNNVDSATNRTNLGLGTAATSASTDFVGTSRTITAGTGLSGGGDLSANRTISVDYASTSEVQGTHTTFSGSHSDTATTINLASVSGISAGDYVVGEGIATGTTVSSVGASSVVISAGLDTDGKGIAGGEPISFYKSTKALSPGLLAGGLCRAWVNFNGSGTVAIRAAYNVSSITDNSIALYTVNLLTAMPDTLYSVSGTAASTIAGTGGTTGRVGVVAPNLNGTYSTTAFQVLTKDTADVHIDSSKVCVQVFR